MLYAYLLTRTEFYIDVKPDLSSADKIFAHSAYIDLLSLLLRITGNYDKGEALGLNKYLASSAVAKSLASDSELKQLLQKSTDKAIDFNELTPYLREAVTASTVFKDYSRKRKHALEDEINLWKTLFETTIGDDSKVIKAFRGKEGFSNAGYHMAIAKLVSTLESYYDARVGYTTALKSLEQSLELAHKLYISMFVLIVRLTEARERQLENAKNKYLATSEDKNPNMRFVENRFANALANNEELKEYIKKYAIDWTDDITLLSSLLEKIMESKVYQDYMSLPESNWEADCEFWRSILKTVIFPSDYLAEALETDSVYWNDDIHIIGTFVLKSIRIDAQDGEEKIHFLPRYKDEEDSRFGAELFEAAVKNRLQYAGYVEKFVDTKNWESDRIAFMDTVIILCAIAEIINFPNIPVAVSLNEYIEIANLYSSAKSGQFINGILYSIIEYLRSEGVIYKN